MEPTRPIGNSVTPPCHQNDEPVPSKWNRIHALFERFETLSCYLPRPPKKEMPTIQEVENAEQQLLKTISRIKEALPKDLLGEEITGSSSQKIVDSPSLFSGFLQTVDDYSLVSFFRPIQRSFCSFPCLKPHNDSLSSDAAAIRKWMNENAQQAPIQKLEPFDSFPYLPKELFLLLQVKRVSFTFKKVAYLPPFVSSLSQLTRLNLSHTTISSIPEELCKLPIRTLLLHKTHLSSLPDNFAELSQLKTLGAVDTIIDKPPASFKTFPKLRFVYLSPTSRPLFQKLLEQHPGVNVQIQHENKPITLTFRKITILSSTPKPADCHCKTLGSRFAIDFTEEIQLSPLQKQHRPLPHNLIPDVD